MQTSYLIAEIVMIPLSGWLSRLLSTRVLFVVSALGFTLFSLACAGASSLGEMVVFRAAQGFIGGAMIPTVFATTFLLFPGEKRTQMSVLIGLTATMAPTIGPTLGGWLTEQFSWHWLFLINVPVGLAVAGAVWSWLDIDKPDYVAAPQLRPARPAADGGVPRRAWNMCWRKATAGTGSRIRPSPGRPSLSAVAGVLFFWRMLTRHDPLVELRAFANANFAFGSLFSFVLGLGLYGSVYLLPLFLARVRGYDSLQIGETMFVTGAAMFLSAPIAGQLARVMDLRVMLAIGLVMFGGGLWWMANLTVDSAFWELFWPQALRGASMMLDHAAGQPDRTRAAAAGGGEERLGAVQSDAQPGRRGRAGDDQHGGDVAAGRAYASIWQEQVTWSRSAATQALGNMTHMLTAAKSGDAHLAALKQVAMMVQQQALTLTYNDVLLLMAGMLLRGAAADVAAGQAGGRRGGARRTEHRGALQSLDHQRSIELRGRPIDACRIRLDTRRHHCNDGSECGLPLA